MTQTLTITLAPATTPDTFATVADVAQFLQVTIASGAQQGACERALAEATEAIRNYCNQHLSLVEDDGIVVDGRAGTWLFLPELPVINVSGVIEDDTLLTVDDDYKLGEHGILHRIDADWAAGVQNIAIVYSHGYETLPDDIIAVCARAASRAYQAGLKAAATDGVPGLSSLSLGDSAAAFASEQGGGVGEGAGGASTSRMLLLSEKDLLNKYRIKRP